MSLVKDFSVGSVVAGKLRIVRPLGVGGMGAVYEVEHEITRHRRALKLLHSNMAEIPGVVERFLREASAAGRIGNSHIVETFDAGHLEGGEPYIVMELLRGETLAEKLNQSGPLEITTACDYLLQACDGVGAAHAAGIIHRDLKPENLFLTGPEGAYIKILDFGISKFDAAITGMEGFTLEGSPIGTPYYMSPEQVRGQKSVDVGTDVYALGVVLYECLTGSRPFDADSLPHLIYQISQGNYAPPSSLRPTLPKVLDAIVAKALAIDRTQRFSSTAELAQALAHLRQSLAPPALEPLAPLSLTPPLESNRGAPALTPDVFLKSAGQHATNPGSHKRRVWIAAASGVVLVTAIGGTLVAASLMRLKTNTAPATSSSLPQEPLASTLAGTGAARTHTIDVAPVPSAAMATSAASTNNAGPASHETASPTRKQSTPAATVAKPSPSASSKNRAAAVGLAQDNPFK